MLQTVYIYIYKYIYIYIYIYIYTPDIHCFWVGRVVYTTDMTYIQAAHGPYFWGRGGRGQRGSHGDQWLRRAARRVAWEVYGGSDMAMVDLTIEHSNFGAYTQKIVPIDVE